MTARPPRRRAATRQKESSRASNAGTVVERAHEDQKTSVVVIGGGVAGLAIAWQLSALGVRGVTLLESEPMVASHASARNAAIFLPLEESLSAVWLASRSRDLLDGRLGTSWLSAQGVALASASEDTLDELRFCARRFGVFHERWGPGQVENKLPLLANSNVHFAVHLPLGGVMDIHLVLTSLRRWALDAGARIRTGARVSGVDVSDGRVLGVFLESGERVECERAIIAAGAWAGQVGALGGAQLPLTPLRRHLVQLVGENMPRWNSPAVWRLDEQVYFRPESGGLLASPCDEEPCAPGVPETDPVQLEQLAGKLERLAPQLADSRVQRSWACLRTMTSDRELAVGEDPRVRGLFWLAGMGGRGMTCGIAAAELLARAMVGLPHPLTRTLAINRLI
jgi:D-arginine dehydrogenase